MSDIPQTVMDKISGYSVQFGYAYDLIKKAAIFGYKLRDDEVAELKQEVIDLTRQLKLEENSSEQLSAEMYRSLKKLTAANKRIEELEVLLKNLHEAGVGALLLSNGYSIPKTKEITEDAWNKFCEEYKLTPLRSPVK